MSHWSFFLSTKIFHHSIVRSDDNTKVLTPSAEIEHENQDIASPSEQFLREFAELPVGYDASPNAESFSGRDCPR